jgi:integrase
MAIRKKGVKFLSDFMHRGTRYRKVFADKKDAKRYEKKLKKHITKGWPLDELLTHKRVATGPAPKRDLTVRQMFDLVLEKKWKGKANYQNAFGHSEMFCKEFGSDTAIRDINTVMIDDFVDSCKNRGNANATIKLKLATLSKALNYCVKREYINRRPSFPTIPVDNERLVFFSKEEEEKIILYLKSECQDYFCDLFCWQLDTGCRPSEALCIKSEHVRRDSSLGYVVDLVSTKNKKQRTVPLTKRAVERFERNKHREYLWSYWTKQRIRSVWEGVRKHMGKENDRNFVFYLTRHTCGSRIVQATGSIYLVKDMLGHKTLSQSMRYAKLSPSNLKRAVCALDGELGVLEVTEYNKEFSKVC